MEKYEKGARFATPPAERLDTQAIGRGTTSPVRSLYRDETESSLGLASMLLLAPVNYFLASIVWTIEMARIMTLPEGAWIVLGFLLDGAGPRSGYDLQAQAARSVAHFWPLTKAHVYTALPRLEAAGYVISQHIQQSGVPDKRVYAPTEQGKVAFGIWLANADLGMAKLRHPLLVKTFFGGTLSRDNFSELLDRHETRCLTEIKRYKALIQGAEAATLLEKARFRMLAIRHGIISLEADLIWIVEARKALGLQECSCHTIFNPPAP